MDCSGRGLIILDKENIRFLAHYLGRYGEQMNRQSDATNKELAI